MKNNETARLSLILAAITISVTLLLSVANMLTKDKIAGLGVIKANEAMKEVLPIATEFSEIKDLNNTNAIVKAVYKATNGADSVGYTVNVMPTGYGGAISMVVGLDNNLSVTGIKVISLSETPGLGTNVDTPAFKAQYNKKAPPLSVIKSGTPKDNEVVAVTGATISSRALTNGVNAAAEAVSGIGSAGPATDKDILAKKEVLPLASDFSEMKGFVNPDAIVKSVYIGTQGANTAGYVVAVSPIGYKGAINMLVGLDNNLLVTGIKITSLQETPGLGQRTDEDAFKSQYKGKAPPFTVIKSGTPKGSEVVAVSGATVSSRAVTKGVNAAADAVKSINKEG